MQRRSEQKDSIFAVSICATRQLFLYRQSSQSKKITEGIAGCAFVAASAAFSGTADSTAVLAIVRFAATYPRGRNFCLCDGLVLLRLVTRNGTCHATCWDMYRTERASDEWGRYAGKHALQRF